MVIKLSRFFYENGGVPTTPVQLGGVSATPVQIDSISANPIQTAGISTTPVQLAWVSALMRTYAVIVFYLQQSTFSSLVYTTKNIRSTFPETGFMSDTNDFRPK